MTDLEEARRKRAEAAPKSPRRPANRSKGGEERRPPLWRWFSTQTAHTDPVRAAAARTIKERWNLSATRFGKIDRDLAGEDSEFLVPFRQLLEEYRILYEIGEGDDDFAREVGSAGPLIPTYVELCRSCHREAIPGTDMCARHGGQWISAKDQADVSRRIHDKLLIAAESSVRVLQDLMDNGRSEQVRLMAATAVLDRAGIGATVNINHTGEITVDSQTEAATAIKARLERLADNMASRSAIESAVDLEPVDAEVVEA